MAEIADFEDFFTQKIEPLVNEYKARSASYGSWGNIFVFSILLFIITIIVYFQASLDGSGFFCFLAFGFLLVCTYQYAIAQDSFVENFKEKIIGEIAAFIIPGNEYKPNSYISSRLFKASCLYRPIVPSIDGDDYVKGIYKNVPFQASEIRSRDSKKRVRAEWPLFDGLFFAADLGRFAGGTYIWQKDNVQLGDSIADERYRLYPIPKVYEINTGSPQFDKYYTVYSSYPAEAHSILSAGIMQNILAFRHQIKRNISLSFVAGRCYVAIPFTEHLLEPAYDITDKETIKEYFFTILLYPAIINQLKLYEYI